MQSLVREFTATAIVIAVTTFTPLVVSAHTFENVQEELFKNEKYLESKNEPAPDFLLQDAAGNPVSLESLRDKVVVLHFIFASCPDVCPLHADRIGEIQEMISVMPIKDKVRFITITTDPENDTPKVMESYGPAHGLDPSTNWDFLTSGPDRPADTTRKLAEKFGHKFTVTEGGAQIHGIVTHIIDQSGQWVANFHGLRFKPINLVVLVNDLIQTNVPHHEEPGSFWQRLRSRLGLGE